MDLQNFQLLAGKGDVQTMGYGGIWYAVCQTHFSAWQPGLMLNLCEKLFGWLFH
jgi:hypothetical protein